MGLRSEITHFHLLADFQFADPIFGKMNQMIQMLLQIRRS